VHGHEIAQLVRASTGLTVWPHEQATIGDLLIGTDDSARKHAEENLRSTKAGSG
jgi:hypothetical protein